MILSLRLLALKKIYESKIKIEDEFLPQECIDLYKVFKFIREGKYYKSRIIKNMIEIMNQWYYVINLINKIPEYQLYEFKQLNKCNINTFFYIFEQNNGYDIANSKYKYDCIAYKLLLEKPVFHIIENLEFCEYNRDFIIMYINKKHNFCEFENNKTHCTYLYLGFRLFLNERFQTNDFSLPRRRITIDFIEHYEFPLTIGISL